MPMPLEYQRASEEYELFLARARENAHLTTRNQTYTMVQAVLVVFRRRLTVEQAIAFAAELPPVLRAIFVADWDISADRKPFGERAELVREIQHFRRDHNFAPTTAIEAVADALLSMVNKQQFIKCVRSFGRDACQFWSIDTE